MALLRKFFLHDGAYQWQHIFTLGAEHTLTKLALPFRVFGKLGLVHTYYTDIGGGTPNSGQAYDYSVVDTVEYPRSTELILTVGMRFFM
jgi:hypothetical protein